MCSCFSCIIDFFFSWNFFALCWILLISMVLLIVFFRGLGASYRFRTCCMWDWWILESWRGLLGLSFFRLREVWSIPCHTIWSAVHVESYKFFNLFDLSQFLSSGKIYAFGIVRKAISFQHGGILCFYINVALVLVRPKCPWAKDAIHIKYVMEKDFVFNMTCLLKECLFYIIFLRNLCKLFVIFIGYCSWVVIWNAKV